MSRKSFVAVAALWFATALAQPGDVPGMIKLIENQPADMDRSTWKEKRRDAARRLAQSKDKRGVPTLVKLAESETFDIIGEIAIEGLGNLGDPAAVPVLQKIANDAARDKPQRELATKALAKLGASPDTPVGPTSGTPDGGTPDGGTPDSGTPDLKGSGADLGGGSTGGGGGLLDDRSAPELPALPALPEDAIAASERVTFALGSAALQYDTVRKRLGFDLDVAGLYAKRVERTSMAWGADAGAHVVAGFINPEGREQVRGTQVNLTGNGEARFYSGKLYGIGKAATGVQISYFSLKGDQADGSADDDDTRYTADVQIALGGGYGRLLDVGGAIRIRRLSRTLDAARALGKPIDAATARQLELTWWALRRERSAYRALVATVAILRKAGVLLTEPDAGLTYEVLNVLRDSQLFARPSGLDVQLVFGEGYLIRPDDSMGGPPASGEEGRVEQALVSAGYGAQLADDTVEISGGAYGRLRLFAPDDQPSPWAVGATARLRRFTYGEHGDPFGAFDLTGDIRVSDADRLDPNQGDDLGMRISGQLGFTWWLDQASGFRLAATTAIDGGEVFIGAQLSATYGFLDATFAGI